MGKRIIKKEKGEYYVYVYLDTRKSGKYVYGEYKFLHEPIYVGKGKQKRAYYFEAHNPFLRHKLAKMGKPVVLLISKQLSEQKAFYLEKVLIALIGRCTLGTGPLCNITDGGEGTSGWHHTEEVRKRLSEVNTGKKHSEATKRRISEVQKGKVITEETKRKMSIANTGKIRTEESKKKMSEIRTGEVRSEEARKNISKAKMGRKLTEEWKQHISKSMKGKVRSEEHQKKLTLAAQNRPPMLEEIKRKISNTKRGRTLTEEHIRNAVAGRKGYKHTEETKRKMSEATKYRLPMSEEIRKKISNTKKEQYHNKVNARNMAHQLSLLE